MRRPSRLLAPVLTALAAALFVPWTAAQTGAVITYGSTSLGVNPSAELNFGGVGLARSGIGDAIIPGCPCEGWGVSLSDGAGTFATFANQSAGSGGFATGNTFSFTGSTATSVVGMAGLPVTVRHAFGPSLQADVFQVQVTIRNDGPTALSNLVYRRAMDWDVPPTTFNEYVTHSGVVANLTSAGGNVQYAGNNGFASSDPRTSPGWSSSVQPLAGGGTVDTTNSNFVKAGPADHGSVFDFAFGSLAGGSSRTFNIYYGSATNEAAALAKISALGADVYSLGQSSGSAGNPLFSDNPSANPTFLFAFGGVGGSEPGSSQDNPIRPFIGTDPLTGAPIFIFDAPPSGRWFDPPYTTGFTIAVTGGDMISVIAPAGFSDLKILVGGVLVDGDFDAGETFTFADGITKFVITGFAPLDQADPGYATAFPLLMNFESTVTSMTWTPVTAVPEPEAYVLMLGVIGALALSARRRRTG